MGILNSVGGIGAWAAGNVLPFLFILTIIVFFHELGHFLVARLCGVAVKTFSIGFGPELIGFTDRKGTRWRVSLIPLGGYVRFLGDENELGKPDRQMLQQLTAEQRAGTFAAKSVGRRAAIVAADCIANFILALVIFTGVFVIFGRQEMSARIDSVVPGSAADRAGFKAGDVIVSIDGTEIKNFEDVQRIVTVSGGTLLSVTLSRSGGNVTLPVTPALQDRDVGFGNKQRVGVLGIQRNVAATDQVVERYSLPRAIGLAFSETSFVAERTVSFLFGLVAGRESADQLGGPIRVAEIAAQAASISFSTLLKIA